ncbi:unnamed protein product [Adineta steineri]|uniref:Uncharacterized protein n=1 Tax=Adineta steineri TaxID=433720 RepID=A0A819DGS4_9BILA|nr:unnamed protein product [Adineta steineri]
MYLKEPHVPFVNRSGIFDWEQTRLEAEHNVQLFPPPVISLQGRQLYGSPSSIADTINCPSLMNHPELHRDHVAKNYKLLRPMPSSYHCFLDPSRRLNDGRLVDDTCNNRTDCCNQNSSVSYDTSTFNNSYNVKQPDFTWYHDNETDLGTILPENYWNRHKLAGTSHSSLLLFKSIIASVQIQNRYLLGDKFTYAENQSITTIDILTGEKKVQQQEAIYIEHIVELNDPLTNTSAEIEKTYKSVRFTPPDERADRRLLSQRTREFFQKEIELSISEYSVGQRWFTKSITNLDKLITVTRIYENDEYNTEAISFDIETVGSITTLGHTIPHHYWIKRDIDVETGAVLSEETIKKTTVIYLRTTDITTRKLIKRETHIHDL